MKKSIFAILLLSLGLASCSKAELGGNEVLVGGEEFTTTLFGRTQDDSKMIVGAETDKGFPCFWTAEDKLTARTAEGSTVGTATLSKGDGSTYGEFNFEVKTAPAAGTTVRLVYPSDKAMAFASNTLATDQVQQGGTQGSCDLSNYAFAYADLEYTATGFPTEFSLKHILSYVCLKMSSPAKDYQGAFISKITISAPEGYSLTGSFSTDYSTLAVTPLSGSNQVIVTFDTPILLNDAEKDIWFTVLPVDLTGQTISISMEGTYKNQPVQIPIEGISGKKLEAGKANVIDYSGFSQKDVVDWYEPVDGRKMVGLGYAYGPQNTFLIQCKDGNTYKGGTYSPVEEYSNTVTFDFRARGDKSKVKDPKNFTIGWLKKDHSILTKSSATESSYTYLPRTSDHTASDINPAGYSFTVDRENYTITVTNNSAHAGSPVLVMADETGKIVWGWTFWNIAADGTKLETVGVTGAMGTYSVANMDIGQPTTNYAKFAENVAGTAVDQVGRFINKYQWGRYLPIFWNSYGSLSWSDGSQAGNIPAVKGPVSLEEALAHPCAFICKADKTALKDWNTTPDGDLWGNLSSSYSVIGEKTNYDPCPKGWKVPNGWHLAKWKEYANKGGVTWNTKAGQIGAVTGGTFFAASGVITNQIGGSATLAATVQGMVKEATGTNGSWWGNHNYQNDGTPTHMTLQNGNTTSNPGLNQSGMAVSKNGFFEDWYHSDATYAQRARAFAVRCIPDNENR